MAKLTLRFKNQAEYDAYWGDTIPGCKYLCVIDSVNVDESGTETVANVLITSSNNFSDEQIELGTAVVETVQEQAVEIKDNDDEISEATEKTENILGI